MSLLRNVIKSSKIHNCADDVLACGYSDANEFDIRELQGFTATPSCDLELYWQSLGK